MEEKKEMKPIWFFVGLTLLVMGGLVLVAGIVMLFTPPPRGTVLAGLRPNLWWGGIMVAAGLLFLVFGGKPR